MVLTSESVLSRFFDAHVHFWDPRQRHHDWLKDAPALQRRFGPADLDTGRHKLTGALFVQADCRDDEALDEVRWVAELAASDPVVRGIVAYAPVQLGARAKTHLHTLADARLVVGVRRLLQGSPIATLADPKLVEGLQLLPEFGLVFDLCATHGQMPAVIALVRACPETTFVLDHLGKPPIAAGQLNPWRAHLSALADCPNTFCKLSGLTTEARLDWTPADLRPYLNHALDVFGPDRCMYGSDWPVASLRTSYEAWADLVLDSISDLAPDDRTLVLSGTATRVYGIGDQPPHNRKDC